MLTVAALIFAAVGWAAAAWAFRKSSRREDELFEMNDVAMDATARLIALRRNAYLTDHDGVRRRYAKVAADVRDRAER